MTGAAAPRSGLIGGVASRHAPTNELAMARPRPGLHPMTMAAACSTADPDTKFSAAIPGPLSSTMEMDELRAQSRAD